MAKQNKKAPVRVLKMNAREAVNFCIGWLSTREKPIVLSRYRDSAPVAQLVGAFCDQNLLPKMRDDVGYDAPTGLEHLTNVTDNVQAAVALDASEILRRMLHDINHLSAKDQNKVIGHFIKKVRQDREAKKNQLHDTRNAVIEDAQRSVDLLEEFDNIVAGNFIVL